MLKFFQLFKVFYFVILSDREENRRQSVMLLFFFFKNENDGFISDCSSVCFVFDFQVLGF